MEGGVGHPVPHLPLLLVVHPGLPAPQWLHLLATWLFVRPHIWSPHHHHAWAAPGGGGVWLLLLGGEAVPALPLPVAVDLALVPVALPGPDGELLFSLLDYLLCTDKGYNL